MFFLFSHTNIIHQPLLSPNPNIFFEKKKLKEPWSVSGLTQPFPLSTILLSSLFFFTYNSMIFRKILSNLHGQSSDLFSDNEARLFVSQAENL